MCCCRWTSSLPCQTFQVPGKAVGAAGIITLARHPSQPCQSPYRQSAPRRSRAARQQPALLQVWTHHQVPALPSGTPIPTGCKSDGFPRAVCAFLPLTDRHLRVSGHPAHLCRSLYFFFNLSLTIYNKFALSSFPFPWTLTCIHSASATIGAYTAYRRGYFQRSTGIGTNENLVLIAFSSLYTVNIAVSNLSLNMVSIPVHQGQSGCRTVVGPTDIPIYYFFSHSLHHAPLHYRNINSSLAQAVLP